MDKYVDIVMKYINTLESVGSISKKEKKYLKLITSIYDLYDKGNLTEEQKKTLNNVIGCLKTKNSCLAKEMDYLCDCGKYSRVLIKCDHTKYSMPIELLSNRYVGSFNTQDNDINISDIINNNLIRLDGYLYDPSLDAWSINIDGEYNSFCYIYPSALGELNSIYIKENDSNSQHDFDFEKVYDKSDSHNLFDKLDINYNGVKYYMYLTNFKLSHKNYLFKFLK